MAKLLIVSIDKTLGNAIAQSAMTAFGFPESRACNHKEAMHEFLTWEPTHVVVLDYNEKPRSGDLEPGFATWRDLKASSTSEHIMRSGWWHYDHPDYVRLPFKMADLYEKLHEE